MRNAMIVRKRTGVGAVAEEPKCSACYFRRVRGIASSLKQTMDFSFDFGKSCGIECAGIFLPTLESRAMLNVTRNFKQIESTSHVMRPGTDLIARPFA